MACSMGAYLQLVTPGIPLLGAWIYAGPTTSRTTASRSRACSRTQRRQMPTAAPAAPRRRYVLERTMDALAAKLGIDRDRAQAQELHHRVPEDHLVGPDDRLRRLPRLARQAARAARPRDARGRPGSPSGAGRRKAARRRFLDLQRDVRSGAVAHPRRDPLRRQEGGRARRSASSRLGSVQVVTGTSPHGQGHETAWAQIVADQLGVDVDDVEVLHGDTAVSQHGLDTYGSRSLAVGGVALWHAGQKVLEKAKRDRRASARGRTRRPRVRGRARSR